MPAQPEARLGQVTVQGKKGDDRREFYVGGEQSGLGVIKKETDTDPENYVNDIFKVSFRKKIENFDFFWLFFKLFDQVFPLACPRIWCGCWRTSA